MHEKTWVLEGTLASVLALAITYYVLQPGAYPSRYGGPLGWSAAIVILVLVVQSFWKTRNSPAELREAKATVRYQFAINRWGGLHVALSIIVSILVLVHAVVFLPSLFEPSLLIWLGAAAFFVLIILNFSGVVTESKRRSHEFGWLKRVHLLLMVFVLALTVAHIEGLMTGFFLRSIIVGAIVGLVGALVVFITVPLTVRISH
jgi:ABC-type multidrug transport system permease subunit